MSKRIRSEAICAKPNSEFGCLLCWVLPCRSSITRTEKSMVCSSLVFWDVIKWCDVWGGAERNRSLALRQKHKSQHYWDQSGRTVAFFGANTKHGWQIWLLHSHWNDPSCQQWCRHRLLLPVLDFQGNLPRDILVFPPFGTDYGRNQIPQLFPLCGRRHLSSFFQQQNQYINVLFFSLLHRSRKVVWSLFRQHIKLNYGMFYMHPFSCICILCEHLNLHNLKKYVWTRQIPKKSKKR